MNAGFFSHVNCHLMVFLALRNLEQDVQFVFFNSSDFEDGASLDGSIEQMERGSLASFGSGTTTDSEPPKVSQPG